MEEKKKLDKDAFPDLVDAPVSREYPYAISEHELEPEMGCNCFWCIESGSKPKQRTRALVAPGTIVDFPEWCPVCGAPADDPEGCWNCAHIWG